MTSIRIAGNTRNPTLLAIRAKGYRITMRYSRGPDGTEDPQYDAEKDGNVFSATSPWELLGLIAMWEVRGDDWYARDDEPDLDQELRDRAPTYNWDGDLVDGPDE